MRSSVKAGVWLAILAVAAALLWWAAPRIIATVAAHRLESYGWSLQDLDMPRQYRFPVHINRIAVTHGNTSVSVSGIVISPLTKATFLVKINDLRIDTGAAASSPTSIRELLAIAGDSMPALLPRGDIAHIEWCAETCISGSAHWLKSGDAFNVSAHLLQWPSAYGVSLLAAVNPAHAHLSIVGSGTTRYLLDGTFDWSQDALQFAIDAHLDAGATPLTLRAASPVVLTAHIRHIDAHAKGQLPMDAPANFESLRQISASLSATVDANWTAKAQTLIASGNQPLSMHGEYGPDHIAIQLDRAMTSRVEGVIASPLSVTIGPGSACDQRAERIDCSLREGDIFGIHSIHGKVSADRHAGTGQVHIAWQGPAADLAQAMRLTGLSDFKILSGEAAATVDADIDTTTTNVQKALRDFRTNLSWRDGNFTWSGYVLEGVGLSASLGGWPHIRSTAPATLTVKEINIGVPIKQISASFGLDASIANGSYSLKGDALTATILGGNLASHDFAFTTATGKGHLNLDFQSVELGELLALTQEQLEGTGRLSGSVPIQITDGKLSIDKGKIWAAPPGGVIRYKPDDRMMAMVAKNAQLQLVADVMSDFRYDALTSDIDYSPEGNLTAHTSLKGNNPGYQNGQEIHFNLQLEENVGTLLKSLRLDGDVIRRVEERVRKAGQATQGAHP